VSERQSEIAAYILVRHRRGNSRAWKFYAIDAAL